MQISKKYTFYLVVQPIFRVHAQTKEILAYELLLRSNKNDLFPFFEFQKLIENRESNGQLMNWYYKEILAIISKTKKVINVNIHPQQFFFPETFDMLNKLTKYSKRICIEITEHDTNPSIKDNSSFFLLGMINTIKKMGYSVALDDVGTGIHTLINIRLLLDAVDVLKLSIISLKQTYQFEIISEINFWSEIAREHNTSFIVEGIDNCVMVTNLVEKGMFLQQGFILGQPEPISKL